MKKGLMMLGVAAIALASCTQNEVMEVAESRAIGFDSFVGKTTKAIIDDEHPLTSFQVFGGYKDLTNNFNDVTVTESNGEWGYQDPQYWEASKTYTFQAYAGAEATATPTANGVTFTGFQAINNADLLASEVVSVTTDGQSKPTSGVNGEGKIDLTFRHVLSMIKFTFTSELAKNVNITISELTVKQLNSKGNYTLSAANTGTWSGLDTPFDYDFNTEGAFTSEASKVSDEVIVMPQAIADKTIEVTFKVSATGGLNITDVAHTVTLPAVTLDEGNCYNFAAKLTAENIIDPENPLVKIEFGDPTVTPWADADGGEVNFPEPTPEP